MGVEAGALKDSDNKKRKLDKSKMKEQEDLQKEKLSKTKKIRESLKADEALVNMREMINDDDLELSLDQVELIKKVISSNDITQNEIEDILEKIDEIENTEDIDKYLPKESRITGEEYKRALTDDIFRVQVITKLDTALTILSSHVGGDSSMGLNLFSGYMAMLDKKLIKIQENHIDIKDNLKEIDKKNNPAQKMGLWESIISFLKKLFN